MFTGNGTKLVGDDALVQKATFNTVVNGNGATPLPAGLYLVLAVASPSGFPPNTTGSAIAAGDFLLVDEGVTITPETGDNVVSMTIEDLCDISNFGMDFSKAEIDVTTQCDDIKVYRQGKADMTGSMSGVFTVGVSDEVEGFLNQFIRINKQDGATSYDSFEQDDSILLGLFYINSKVEVADRLAVIAPFILFGYSVGGEEGAPQSFDATFRFSNFSYTDDTYSQAIEPTFYRWGTEETT
jgi:hypothetical protein